MKMISDALNDMLSRLTLQNEESSYKKEEDYGHSSSSTEGRTVVRLRLDAEVDGKNPTAAEIFEKLKHDFMLDLEDLVENGDTSHPSDPFLMVMNGSKLRGQEPVMVDIPHAAMYSQYSWTKDVTEKTIFILLAVEWSQ